ncbi:MAG: hypothetical protein ACYTBJ_10250 [Planctomycetota bacterium]|jgi:hypothetical protein
MARNRGKKALYEVISRTRPRSGPAEPVQQVAPPEGVKDEPAGAAQEVSAQWPTRPKIVQVNAGRIELSVPYQLGIALLLLMVLGFLSVYRLGQSIGSSSRRPGRSTLATFEEEQIEETPGFTMRMPPAVPELPETTTTTETGGDNVIVLVEYDKRRDLEPVQKHFAEHQIETEIVLAPSGKYYLWTKKRYKSIAPNTPGDEAMQRIKAVGSLYKGKAPAGLESFAPHYFGDCYFMKVSK